MVVVTTREGKREKLAFDTIAELVTWLREGNGEFIRFHPLHFLRWSVLEY